jgi:hypothetical protein
LTIEVTDVAPVDKADGVGMPRIGYRLE